MYTVNTKRPRKQDTKNLTSRFVSHIAGGGVKFVAERSEAKILFNCHIKIVNIWATLRRYYTMRNSLYSAGHISKLQCLFQLYGTLFRIGVAIFQLNDAPLYFAMPFFNLTRPSFYFVGFDFNIALPLSTLWDSLATF